VHYRRTLPQKKNVLGRILIRIYTFINQTSYISPLLLQFIILVGFFSICILATWCLDAYNATVESGLIASNDTRFIAANAMYNIYPITIAACIIGVFLWLVTVCTHHDTLISLLNSLTQSYVFIVSLVVYRTTYDDITAGLTAPKPSA